MARVRGRRLKRRIAKKLQRGRRRIPKSLGVSNDFGQMARIKETIEFTDINPTLNYNFVFSLAQFARASVLAPSFKWYKATMVEWTIEPLYNTFQDGTAGTEVSVPYYYTVMNRTQDKSALNLDDYQAQGSKPKKLVAKTTIKYRPNWCSGGLSAYYFNNNGTMAPLQYTYAQTPMLGLQQQYGWLASPHTILDQNETSVINPIQPDGDLAPPGSLLPPLTGMNPVYANKVVYNGFSMLVDQSVPTGTLQPVARVVCTVHWAFKGPQCNYRPNDGVVAAPKTA